MNNDSWIETYTGQKIDLLRPRPEDINIGDIAHALSNLCRFGGHSADFYSVAQHSYHVAQCLAARYPGDDLLLLQGLIHDATEAYVGDMVRPLKRYMLDFAAAEERVNKAIHTALGVPLPGPIAKSVIKDADNALLLAERRDLFFRNHLDWSIAGIAWGGSVIPLSPTNARLLFLNLWRKLKK